MSILIGDNRETLPTLPAGHFHCAMTSPPYFGLRSYLPKGHADKCREIGSEAYAELARVRIDTPPRWTMPKANGKARPPMENQMQLFTETSQ